MTGDWKTFALIDRLLKSYVNPSPVALFLSTNTAVAELIFKIYLFIPTKIKNS